MKIFKSPVFILCCLLFVLHQLLQKFAGTHVLMIDDYLDAFLAMPIILTLLTAERRVLFRRGNHYHLPVLDVLVATILIAFVSEVVFPFYSDNFRQDWLDVIFFFLGSMLFYLTINQKA